ncbi:50S ribosomal protein L24 [Candidatus Azambacteria bacterium RIFOXYD1_FULL_42_11]|uniref:Large ribosomal subunit protein uL24 n=1 Tax=Candidatus Azambacteria bacterium RIFOXYD1_FULL_42_11 TaxID=1797310 RepID=A0A1F5CGI6_9BACT|nr:MAG: 50S ribosomal protein L24 [Candidatus Azambacteria bacterium RIFOXYD1_FULL_42_11]
MRIKKGDNIIVISGKDRGKQGKVIKVLPGDNKVIVENINLKKKHQRPKTAGKKGEKIEVPRSFSASSVMIVCKNCGKPTRIGRKILIDNKKIRVCKKCKSEI